MERNLISTQTHPYPLDDEIWNKFYLNKSSTTQLNN